MFQILDGCPDCWVAMFSSCYYYSNETMTWSKARSKCRSFGADLAVPESAEEDNAIWEVAKQTRLNGSGPYIGIRRRRDHNFYTVYRKKLNYTNWKSGEPNEMKNLSRNCVNYWHTDGTWTHTSCAKSSSFICELSASRFWPSFFFFFSSIVIIKASSWKIFVSRLYLHNVLIFLAPAGYCKRHYANYEASRIW